MIYYSREIEIVKTIFSENVKNITDNLHNGKRFHGTFRRICPDLPALFTAELVQWAMVECRKEICLVFHSRKIRLNCGKAAILLLQIQAGGAYKMKRWNDALRRWRSAVMTFFLLLSLAGAANAASLVPCGQTAGIRLWTEGLVVTGVEENSPAAKCGIERGDIIISVNGKAVTDAQQVKQLVQSGENLVLCAEREGKTAEYYLTPQRSEAECRLGLFLRDSIAGIGTITYYDPETGSYGALGHGVYDPDSTRLVRIRGGNLYPSSVAEIRKGERGAPGQLTGEFDLTKTTGTVNINSAGGIFGTLSRLPDEPAALAVDSGEAELGEAVILANVSGTEVEAYAVRIDRLYPGAGNGRDILLTVTDPKLLELTGGIVQGMSGSPILQNGKLVGAVTHVLVNSPERGYGIGIDTMLGFAQ